MRTKRNRLNRNQYGATLAELMISTVIFGFITLGLLSIIQFGTKSWRHVESRYDVEKGIRRAIVDLNYNLRNTDITTFNTGISNDKISWMAFKIPASYSATGEIFEDQLAIDTTTNKLMWNFYALYYARRPDGCPACAKIGITDAAQCPHKQLIKKTIFVGDSSTVGMPPGMNAVDGCANKLTSLTNNNLALTNASLTSLLTAPNLAQGDKVLVQDVVNFNINFNDNVTDKTKARPNGTTAKPGSVQYTLRCFKELEASQVHVSVDSFSNRKFSDKFTIQFDQGIIPMNNGANTSGSGSSS